MGIVISKYVPCVKVTRFFKSEIWMGMDPVKLLPSGDYEGKTKDKNSL